MDMQVQEVVGVSDQRESRDRVDDLMTFSQIDRERSEKPNGAISDLTTFKRSAGWAIHPALCC
jgi:hypothetical protein